MIIVGNGTVITLDDQQRVIENGAVLIEKDRILDVGKTEDLMQRFSDVTFIDAKHGLIMPGMTNIHTHFYSAFARGMAVPGEPAQNFPQILERLWWKLDKALNLEAVYYSALVSMIENIKNGTTTIIDHHASPFAVTESLLHIAKAAEFTGIRTSLCYEVSDRDGEKVTKQGIEENKRFIEYTQKADNPLLKGTFGIHASFTVSDQTLEHCATVCKDLNSGIHIHVAEDRFDVEETERQFGISVVERLEKFRLLGPKTIAAHCVHITEQEIDILVRTQTAVAHNPESNMGNAVGCAPIKKFLEAGMRVGMGTDGYTSDMFEGIKVGNLLHKHENKDPQAAWVEIPQMIFTNNREILTNHFGQPLGVLKPGAYADVITIDYHPTTPIHKDNYYGHLLFGVSGGMVNTTIIGGKIRMCDRQLVEIDEKEITRMARQLAKTLWSQL
ncbi:chlorohydrolase [Desulfuribacillus stibiiarsenatis]|uniref:Chlorohydrolase n=1 Tax=Desulfuribacillus stibiiarsenatis TaxID=1390249 RepID=A0A1E5L2V3_9FIRM|nr:putative aminohydrolase SsnA [Desulfuribacillus stibiiarsenatis]OEH84269.1 chlorohydrolase [Desulfuribacillus stibiiarsenatis]